MPKKKVRLGRPRQVVSSRRAKGQLPLPGYNSNRQSFALIFHVDQKCLANCLQVFETSCARNRSIVEVVSDLGFLVTLVDRVLKIGRDFNPRFNRRIPIWLEFVLLAQRHHAWRRKRWSRRHKRNTCGHRWYAAARVAWGHGGGTGITCRHCITSTTLENACIRFGCD